MSPVSSEKSQVTCSSAPDRSVPLSSNTSILLQLNSRFCGRTYTLPSLARRMERAYNPPLGGITMVCSVPPVLLLLTSTRRCAGRESIRGPVEEGSGVCAREGSDKVRCIRAGEVGEGSLKRTSKGWEVLLRSTTGERTERCMLPSETMRSKRTNRGLPRRGAGRSSRENLPALRRGMSDISLYPSNCTAIVCPSSLKSRWRL
mmetsp:Transcript_43482/g.72412  ORF Transcript_43482/g.72412 Transcript_43482/m.72412 type:complete len:203 (+) Transcript_43482:1366-1974(+)